MEYTTVDRCSGHDYDATKSWLEGYYFTDESVLTQTLTNQELTQVLDPSSEQYKNYINFVYDSSTYEWCAGSASWFA